MKNNQVQFKCVAQSLPRKSKVELKKERKDLVREFSRTPLGKRILIWAKANKIGLQIVNDLDGRRGCYRLKNKKIIIKSSSDTLQKVQTLAHELRHAWQHTVMRPAFLARAYNPFAAIVVTRFIEADAFSFGGLFMLKHASQDFGTLSAHDKKRVKSILKPAMNLPKYKNVEKGSVLMRRVCFDLFFGDLNKDLRERYDRKSHSNASSQSKRDLFLKYMTDELLKDKFHTGVVLCEKDLLIVGQDAWGECNNQDYMKIPNLPFNYGDDYASNLPSDVKKSQTCLARSLPYKSVNSLTLRDGSRRPILKL